MRINQLLIEALYATYQIELIDELLSSFLLIKARIVIIGCKVQRSLIYCQLDWLLLEIDNDLGV